MKTKVLYFFSIILLKFNLLYQICSPTPLQIGAPDNNNIAIDGGGNCDLKIKVKDEKPYINCNFNGDVLYPVFIEYGNYKEDLPNNFRFSLPYRNDDLSGSYPPKGYSWLADAYNNGNVYTDNGKIVLEWKKETKYGPVVPGGSNESFIFTGGILWSLFKVKGGIFLSKIKLPENGHFWPAYWLYNVQEIDVFEFFDNYLNSGICDTYHHWKINIHGYNDNWIINQSHNGTHCNRNRKLKVCNNFFNNYHDFKLFWSDYLIQISDGTKYIAYATKYFNSVNRFNTGGGCHIDINGGGTPQKPYTCNDVLNLQDCNLTMPWGDCWDWNEILKDVTFPMSSIPMNFIISNGVNPNSGNAQQFYDTWDNYSSLNKKILIDEIIIYQPIKCYQNYTIYNEGEFKNYSGGTNFLGGGKIVIGSSYINESPKASNNWHEFPTHILATDQIAFIAYSADVIFEEGTFLRAEIIDCSTGIGVSQRTMPNGDTLPPVLPINYFDNDTLLNIYNTTYGKPLMSETDNGALQIFPIPAQDKFFIDLNEEDWYDLQKIELVNTLGEVKELPKEVMQNVSELSNGIYFVKFYFSSGIIVVKPLVVQR